jgi:hypothetical protein
MTFLKQLWYNLTNDRYQPVYVQKNMRVVEASGADVIRYLQLIGWKGEAKYDTRRH